MKKINEKRPFMVGLTGGIGAGKSTVAQLFSDLGVPVIDADKISRELLATGSALLEKVVAHFGGKILTADKNLDRAYLRQRILDNPNEKKWLEQLLHPAIFAQLHTQVVAQTTPYVIVVIPLLFETDRQDFVDRILVVDAPEALQLQRASQRDQTSLEQIMAMMQHQCSRKTRLIAADDVIANDNDRAALKAKVQHLHDKYVQMVC